MARPKHKAVATVATASSDPDDPEVVLQELFSRELDKRVGTHADFETRAAALSCSRGSSSTSTKAAMTTTTTAANDYRDVDQVAIQAFRNALDARVGRDCDFATRESAGLGLANVLCGLDQKEDSDRRSAMFTRDELWIEGRHYKRHDKQKTSTVVYHGLCGPLDVARALYREAGVRNGPTVVPLELDAGLLEGMTPALAEAVAHGYAESPSRISNDYLRAAHRVPPSRSTTERAAKRLGAAMEEALDSIEPIIRAEETLPEGTCGISLGIDRTSVPMEEPAGPNKKPLTRTKPYLRAVPDPIL